jgi:hypothetical protein
MTVIRGLRSVSFGSCKLMLMRASECKRTEPSGQTSARS